MRRTIALFTMLGVLIPIALLAAWSSATANNVTDQNRARLLLASRILWPTFGLIGPAVGDPASQGYVRKRYVLAIGANVPLYAALGIAFSFAHRWRKPRRTAVGSTQPR
jgi:hypothetical protein